MKPGRQPDPRTMPRTISRSWRIDAVSLAAARPPVDELVRRSRPSSRLAPWPLSRRIDSDAVPLQRQADDHRADRRGECADDAGHADLGDDRSAAQKHDPSDTVRMVLGKAERPDVADRSADHVDPVDAEPVEDPGRSGPRRRPVRPPRGYSTGVLSPQPGRSRTRTGTPRMPAIKRRPMNRDRRCRGRTAPAVPIPPPARGAVPVAGRCSTNRFRGANPWCCHSRVSASEISLDRTRFACGVAIAWSVIGTTPPGRRFSEPPAPVPPSGAPSRGARPAWRPARRRTPRRGRRRPRASTRRRTGTGRRGSTGPAPSG